MSAFPGKTTSLVFSVHPQEQTQELNPDYIFEKSIAAFGKESSPEYLYK